MDISQVPYGYIQCTDEQFPKILSINEHMLKLLKLSLDDPSWHNFYKENFYFILAGQEREKFREEMEESKKTGEITCFHNQIINTINEKLSFITLIKYNALESHSSFFSMVFIKDDTASSKPVNPSMIDSRDTMSSDPEKRTNNHDPLMPEGPVPTSSEGGASPLLSENALPAQGVFARTFGHFDLFCDGKPVYFSNTKEKELLALLIDRHGGTVSSPEAISILWPDQVVDSKLKSRYRKLSMTLNQTLEKHHISQILNSRYGTRNINVDQLTCDYYELLNGNKFYKKAFHNVYMSDYSWAEDTLASLWDYS